MGLLFYTLLTGNDPSFIRKGTRSNYANTADFGRYAFDETNWPRDFQKWRASLKKEVNPLFALIEAMTMENPAERISTQEVVLRLSALSAATPL